MIRRRQLIGGICRAAHSSSAKARINACYSNSRSARKGILPIAAGIAVISGASIYFCSREKLLPPAALTLCLNLNGKKPIDPAIVVEIKNAMRVKFLKMVEEADAWQESICSPLDDGPQACEAWTKEDIRQMLVDSTDALDKELRLMNDLSNPNIGSAGSAQLIAFLALIGDEGTLIELKENGLNLNVADDRNGFCALHYLVGNEDCRCRSRHQARGVEILLRLGANPNVLNRDGFTPLDLWYARITSPGVFDGLFAQAKKENLAKAAELLVKAGGRSEIYQLSAMMVSTVRGDVSAFEDELGRDPSRIFHTTADGRTLTTLVQSEFYLGNAQARARILETLKQYGVELTGPHDMDAFLKFVTSGR